MVKLLEDVFGCTTTSLAKVYTTPLLHTVLSGGIEERMVSNLGWLFDWMGRKGAFWEDSWATLRVPISLLCFYLCYIVVAASSY